MYSSPMRDSPPMFFHAVYKRDISPIPFWDDYNNYCLSKDTSHTTLKLYSLFFVNSKEYSITFLS